MAKNFEASLKQLNDIVEKMEKGGLSLEESLKQFESGVKLIRTCQEQLKNAQQKIEIYNKDKNKLDNFNPGESDQ